MNKRISLIAALLAVFLATTTVFAQGAVGTTLPANTTRLYFNFGTSAYTLSANLVAGTAQGYVLGVAGGQTVYLTKSGSAQVSVMDPGGNFIGGMTAQPGPVGVHIPQTGDYTVVLNGQGMTTVSIYIPPFGVSQTRPAPYPLFLFPLHFAPGTSSYTFKQDLYQGYAAGYLLGISAGQQMSITTQGNMTVAVLDSNGNGLQGTSTGLGQWNYAVPATGNYSLVLLGTGRNLISISIPPAGSPVVGQRIRFAPGYDSITVQLTLAGGPKQTYILGAAAGQTMYVTTYNVTLFQVYGPDGNSIPGVTTPGGDTSYYLAGTGDYTILVAPGHGLSSMTLYIPPPPTSVSY